MSCLLLCTDSIPPSDMDMFVWNVIDSRYVNSGDRYQNTSPMSKEGSLRRQLDVPIIELVHFKGFSTQRLHKVSVI